MPTLSFISGFLTLFQICGMCSAYQKGQKLTQYFIIFWSLCHIFIIFGILLIVYFYYGAIVFADDATGQFSDVIQILVPITTHLIMVLSGIICRDREVKIWTDIAKLDNILVQYFDLKAESRSLIKDYMILFVLLHIIGLIPELYIIVTLSREIGNQWVLTFYVRLYSFVSIRVGIMHYLLYIKYLESRHKIVVELLTSYKGKQSRLRDFTPKTNQSYEFIREIKLVVVIVSRITDNVNGRFGFTLIALMINFFIVITVDLYWVIRKIWLVNLRLLNQGVACAVSPLSSWAFLMYSCGRYSENAQAIGPALHTINRNKYNAPCGNLIRLVSLQLKQELFTLSAYRFFYMDFGFMCDMIGAIITYLIIFVQTIPTD